MKKSEIIMGIGGLIIIIGFLIGHIYNPKPPTRLSEGLRGISVIGGVLVVAVGALIRRAENKKKTGR